MMGKSMWLATMVAVMVMACGSSLGAQEALPGLAAGQPAMVELKAHASVRGQNITLRDIAEVSGIADSTLSGRLNALEIVASPRPGQERQIDREYVRLRLAQNFSGIAPLQFGGAAAVTVQRAFRIIGGEEIEARVREFCAASLGDEATVEISGRIEQQMVPDGEYEVRIEGKMSRAPFSGKALVFARIYSGDALYCTVPVQAVIRRFCTVLRAKTQIEKGAVIQPGDLELVREEATARVGACLARVEDAAGKTAKVSIMAGRLIDGSMIAAPIVVRRKAGVNAVIETGTLRIACRAVALEDGAVGDMIRVRNPSSNKDLYGEIVSASEVRIYQ